jgi:hypothetical protein
MQMQKQLTAALKKDRLAWMDSEGGGQEVRNLASGRMFNTDGEHAEAMHYWIQEIRDRYYGHVIRRTVTSLDNEGKHIIGLEPFQEHDLVMDLYPWEMAHLEKVAGQVASERGSGIAAFASGKVSDFLS